TVVVRIFGWRCNIRFTITIFVRWCSSIRIRLVFVWHTIFVGIFVTIRCSVTIRIRVSWVSTDEFFIFVVHTIAINIRVLVIRNAIAICIFRLLDWFVRTIIFTWFIISPSIWFIRAIVFTWFIISTSAWFVRTIISTSIWFIISTGAWFIRSIVFTWFIVSTSAWLIRTIIVTWFIVFASAWLVRTVVVRIFGWRCNIWLTIF